MIQYPQALSGRSRLGFGTAALSGLDDRRRIWNLLDAALESGITHFDTARLYGDGIMERTLSPFIQSNRDYITITTKFGLSGRWRGEMACRCVPAARKWIKRLLRHRPKAHEDSLLFQEPPLPQLNPKAMRASLSISLKELGVEHIDVFLMHEARRDQISDSLLEALESEREAGRIGRYGSGGEWNNTEKLISLAWRHKPVIQMPASVILASTKLIPLSPAPDIIHSTFRGMSLVQKMIFENRDLTKNFPGEAFEQSLTLPRLFLQWALYRHPKSMILFGTRRLENIKNNTMTAACGHNADLLDRQLEWLEKLIARMSLTPRCSNDL